MSLHRSRSHLPVERARAGAPARRCESHKKRALLAGSSIMRRKRGPGAPNYPRAAQDRNAPVRRCRVSPLMMLMIAWGGITIVLIVLLIYRSTLSMHEDDQLFLDDASTHMQQE